MVMMSITSSTRRTSINGVVFISIIGRGVDWAAMRMALSFDDDVTTSHQLSGEASRSFEIGSNQKGRPHRAALRFPQARKAL
jgi:hypothetical protein